MVNYNEEYKKNKDLFWTEPLDIVVKAHNLWIIKSKVLDLWCWEGRNSIYLLSKWYEVIGVDSSKVALDNFKDKINNIISDENYKLILSDIIKYEIKKYHSTILSTFTIHFLWDKQKKFLEDVIKKSEIGSSHIIKIFLNNWSINWNYKYLSSWELLNMYKNFEILHYNEYEEWTFESKRTKTNFVAEIIAVKK
jgi:hypothetical protein